MTTNATIQRQIESKLIENFGTSPEEAAKRAQLALDVIERVKAAPGDEQKHSAMQRARSNNQLDEQLMSAALTIAALLPV